MACGLTQFPPGFTITWDGQVYRPAGLREHHRRDGVVTVLVDWHTDCPSCGQGMLVATTLNFHAPRRRCDDCKAPGRSIRQERRRAESGTRETEEAPASIHVITGRTTP